MIILNIKKFFKFLMYPHQISQILEDDFRYTLAYQDFKKFSNFFIKYSQIFTNFRFFKI